MTKENQTEDLKPNAVATTQTSMPAMATNVDNRGFDDVDDQDDFEIPRAKLLQALSPEVVESPKEFYPGMIIDSTTKEVLNTDADGNFKAVTIIPLRKFTEWARFNPRDNKDPNFSKDYEPGEMIWKTDNPDDPRTEQAKFGPNGEMPVATKFMNFLCLIPETGSPIPLVVSFSKTSFSAGKALNTLARRVNMSKGTPLFGATYKLGVKQETNDKGTFYIYTVKQSAFVEGDDFKMAERLYNAFAQKKIEVDYNEGGSHSESSTDDTPPTQPAAAEQASAEQADW